ncbi:uncharacterized protein LY89DRAFT_720446 [Mollisia scopiformis]|uniref:lytic cellulose monooxygenase (C4-dehydrogenating) n=1 Tax=Mollisia scopiformis TaxID=149040 RepID=A0A194X4D5_MOLSC|nr:uncharacterized protein LY89DRAFT_720446 [Mollisia scopiformis]KUJ15040.1 hypothetical protein LY89DRAFT_720446 [Mollisia scopiformis]
MIDRFSKLIVDGQTDAKEWTYVRETKNYQDDHGVTDVSSVDLRCFQYKGAASTVTVAAGDSLGFVADQGVDHPGPVQFYMAKVPDGTTTDAWDGPGKVWFKIGYLGHNVTAKGIEWPTYTPTIQKNVFVKIPKNVPMGSYLVRVESIALHQAQQAGGAQFYLGCAQVTVTGGGSGTPSPLVSFPGVYKISDAGLILPVYPVPTSYTPPGPAIWEG